METENQDAAEDYSSTKLKQDLAPAFYQSTGPVEQSLHSQQSIISHRISNKSDIFSPGCQYPQQTVGWTSYLVFCNFTVILGASFMFGYNLSVVNAPYPVLVQFFNQSFLHSGIILEQSELETQFTLAVTLYFIGGIVGSTWFPSFLAHKIGKKRALIIGAFVGALGQAIIFMSPYLDSYATFMVGRTVVGLQAGLALVLGPALVNEHAPAPLRGACGSIFCAGVATGVQTANVLALPFILGQEHLWQHLFLVVAILFLCQALLLCFVAESPRWLVDNERHNEACLALVRLRNAVGQENAVAPEFEEIKQLAVDESKIRALSIGDIFRNRQLWLPMAMTIFLHINNELTGLSAVLIYASVVMTTNVGLDVTTAAIANLGLTFGLLIGNILCALLADRFGRRKLMLIGTFAVIIFHVFLVVVLAFEIAAACIAGFALFLIVFSSGPGPIPWFMPAEMFSQAGRPLALSIAMFTNWAGNIIVTFGFPLMNAQIGFYSFLPFAAIAGVDFIVFLLFLPETAYNLKNYSQV